MKTSPYAGLVDDDFRRGVMRMSETEIAAEVEKRAAAAREFRTKVQERPGEVTEEDLAATKRIAGELEYLEASLVTQPHPGHPVPRGGWAHRASHKAGEFGRIPGIGASFLKGLGVDGPDGLKALDGTSGGTMVAPFYDPNIRELPQRALFVRSVVPTVPHGSDKVWYLRQSVATQAAAPVAAGGQKPKSTYTIERIEESVRTIAHVTEALDRALLMDHDQLTGFLDGQLRLGVLLAEENQIINGNGTAPNLRGILNVVGIQTQAKGTDPTPDTFYKAFTKLRTSFFEPDAVIVHPNDWQDIRLLRTADGIYIFGPPSEDGEERMWGRRVITSPVIAEGTALVGAFGIGCKVWDREQARVTFAETGLGDTAGQEMFDRNQVRWRGESRLAFGVERPLAFCSVTGI